MRVVQRDRAQMTNSVHDAYLLHADVYPGDIKVF